MKDTAKLSKTPLLEMSYDISLTLYTETERVCSGSSFLGNFSVFFGRTESSFTRDKGEFDVESLTFRFWLIAERSL